MSYADYQRRLVHQVEKYKRKTGADAVAGWFNRLDLNTNFSMASFAWQLNLAITINIDVNVILNPAIKAKYGSAIYGTSVYDPTTVLGVLAADSLTKWLMLHMARRFLPPNERGYKYNMPQSLYWLNAEIPMLEVAAEEAVWYVRVRKIDATRNWTAFYDMAFFDVNAYPTEPYHDSVLGDMDSEVFIRFSEMLRCIFDIARFEDAIFDYLLNSLLQLDNIFNNTHRQNNISANFFDTAIFDRAPFSGLSMPYQELYLLSPNLVAYMPVFDVANFDFDVYYTTVSFDEDLVNSIVENAKQTQQGQYRELVTFTGEQRRNALYQVHAAFQVDRQYRLQKILNDYAVPRVDVLMYHAFMMEYSYKRMYEQLIDKETVIQRYIRLGLNETVLRAIAVMSGR